MTAGEKIKRIRCHRQMTQKELGEKIGLGAGGANRIAQYEMGYRIPQKPLLEKMAEALNVSAMALSEGGNSAAADRIRRIANRVARGGHDIPTRDVKRHFARRFRDLAKLLPLCNEATFYDNDNDFRVVAFYRNGELLSATDAPPDWLIELRQEITL